MKARQALVRRYRYLWRGELVAAGVFLVLFVVVMPSGALWRDWLLRIYGIALLILLLCQGALWWRGRLLDLLAGRQRPFPKTLRRFELWRRINWILIGIFPLLAVWQMSGPGSAPPPSVDLWWGIALVLAATLEQVNYFHYQLSYGYGLDFWYLRRHRRLRRGNIARYLDPPPEGPISGGPAAVDGP